MFRTRHRIKSMLLMVCLLFLAGCSQSVTSSDASIVLATTTSTEDTGLLDHLLPAFQKKTGISVKVVAVGTGQAIRMGVDGNADVLLVHSRPDEDNFVDDGYGEYAHDLMFNQFYLVGPPEDPAGVKQSGTILDAFKQIAVKQALFISRGDDSGTDKKEKSIWKGAGIRPAGDWYFSAGQGMGATLQMADEKKAYTLTDEATFLQRRLSLQPLLTGDPMLHNPYGIMLVSSSEKKAAGKQLIDFLVSPEGQELIAAFGVDAYGKNIFQPSAKKR